VLAPGGFFTGSAGVEPEFDPGSGVHPVEPGIATDTETEHVRPPGAGTGRIEAEHHRCGHRSEHQRFTAAVYWHVASPHSPTGRRPLRHRAGGRVVRPTDPLLTVVEVLVARPDPPAALSGCEEPCPVDLAGAPLRTATGVRPVRPAAVAVAVDREGDRVPLDHAMTVRPVADTPVKIRNICYRIADALAMARQRNAGGRPHKGDRKLFSTRLPQDLAELMSAEADEFDLTYSDYLANLVAEHFGRGLLVAPAPQLEERLIA
jgi:hypothetical protein